MKYHRTSCERDGSSRTSSHRPWKCRNLCRPSTQSLAHNLHLRHVDQTNVRFKTEELGKPILYLVPKPDAHGCLLAHPCEASPQVEPQKFFVARQSCPQRSANSMCKQGPRICTFLDLIHTIPLLIHTDDCSANRVPSRARVSMQWTAPALPPSTEHSKVPFPSRSCRSSIVRIKVRDARELEGGLADPANCVTYLAGR